MGNYTSPAQMRASLANVITDEQMLEKVVGDYFKRNAPAPVSKQAPVTGYRPKAHYAAPAKSSIVQQDEDYHTHMERGSEALAQAIETMLAGGVPKTPSRLIWSTVSGADAGQGVTERDAIPRPTYKVVTYSTPCMKCGAARSCAHRGGE
ncbi:hypothetical protein CMI47_05065 [Candidatus Pacearchaeota archaeon]|jgi:hypothetical protein|nr:hypothetical protein [Candidatus Pacearchaeota archaeon]|tara:strand:- start:8003 stop:8452 length:450 start_codon:yes stop_codon:yes gene_type:complete